MDITIAGGGIGGLALALALDRVGLAARVLEAHEQQRPGRGGAFLNLAPNGMHVLAVGLADEVAARGFPTTGIRFRNAHGRQVGFVDTSDQRARFGTDDVMVRRVDLHEVLLGAVERAGIDVRHDRAVDRVDEDADGVDVHLADGGRVHTALLLGADGVHSPTRAHVAGPDARPQHLGMLDLAGFSTHVPPGLAPGEQQMVFGRTAFFACVVTPDDGTWWFANVPIARQGAPRRSAEDWRDELLRLHRDDPAWIAPVLRDSEPPLGPWPMTDLPSLPRWHTERVCLLGDAAHATSPSAGQGASLAIEDAVELARSLADHSPGRRAFAAFEALRRPRVEPLVRTARRNSANKAPGPVGRVVRDLLLPVFLRLGARETTAAHGHRTAPLSRTDTPAGDIR